jgi:sugar lactone lactonase YvrE
MSREVVALANYHCKIGENPLWHAEEQRIYWLDIETGRLFRLDHATGEHECFYRGPVVGGFTLQADGSLLLFEADRIVRLESNGSRRVLREGIDAGMARFNDVIADPEGRVYAGTIGRTNESGGVYRVERDGSIECLWKGTGCANGMGFTADSTRFYWTCSTTRTIFQFDYDRATGHLGGRRPFDHVPEPNGTPDGLTLDIDDAIWTARWGDGVVVKMNAAGAELDRVSFPVKKTSSVAFGGPDLDTLYVTTAGGDGEGKTASADGTLYRVKVAARGRVEFRSRVGL